MKYVVAYISFHDNNLEMFLVDAIDSMAAIEKILFDKGFMFPHSATTVKELQNICFDSDCMVNAIEVP